MGFPLTDGYAHSSSATFISTALIELPLHILDREGGIEPPVISPLKRYR